MIERVEAIRSSAWLIRIAAPVVALALLASGCTAPTQPNVSPSPSLSPTAGIRISAVPGIAVDRPTTTPSQPDVDGLVVGLPGRGLTPYLKQKLSWRNCHEGDDTVCTTVLAPLDYADPQSRAVTLALRKLPATATPRLGTLFINPGGPGASGRDLVSSFDSAGLEQYDILGWDPRGTGGSTPIRCLSDAQAEAYANLDASPDDAAEREALIQANYDFGQSCRERNGDLLDHIGTVDTVQDLDLLRALVKDSSLNYLGYSYGTQIGATYAELYGGNVGHLVLDAAVDITDNSEVIQAQGFDLALGNFAAWCADQQCGLGDTKKKVLATITTFIDDLDAHPLPVEDRMLTQTLAMTGIAMALYGGKASWDPLAVILRRAMAGDGSNLLLAADQLNGRDEDGHFDTMFYAFPAISCLDTKEKGVLDADRVWAVDQRKAPIFGKYFGPSYTCPLWPARPSSYLTLHLKGAAAPPIVVIGGTGDNATPYQQAVSMADQLRSAVLVTYEGQGHGSYGKSACINKVVVAYLTKNDVPADGTRCT